ncbi:MAG: hypothetical protein JKY96_02375 [Phycisphaerales bacterium]|nr:hypothetical protein [Phycisphaerales bacterium]
MDILNTHPAGDREEPIWTPQTGPPQTDRIPVAVYEAMGETQITAFFHAFYRRLGESSVADLFPKSEQNLMRAADKSAAMFVFLFGGPHVYQKKYGRPMMRARHLPFVIDEAARQEWLRCYRETLDEAPELFAMPAEHVDAVWKFVVDFSAWMVNAETKED